MVATIIGWCFIAGAILWALGAWLKTGMAESKTAQDWRNALPAWIAAIMPLAIGIALVWR